MENSYLASDLSLDVTLPIVKVRSYISLRVEGDYRENHMVRRSISEGWATSPRVRRGVDGVIDTSVGRLDKIRVVACVKKVWLLGMNLSIFSRVGDIYLCFILDNDIILYHHIP